MVKKQKLIRKLKDLEVIGTGEIKLTNGGLTDFYIDLKKTYGRPDIVDLMCSCIRPHLKDVTCVAGMGHGGIPLATALSLKYNLKLSLVREKPRQHGTCKQIDGHMPTAKDIVLVVDDVVTTGGSLKKIVNALKQSKAKISVCAVVKRGNFKMKEPFHYILEAKDLI